MATFIIQLRIWGYENLYSSKYAKEDSSMNLRFAIITTNCNQITVKYEHIFNGFLTQQCIGSFSICIFIWNYDVNLCTNFGIRPLISITNSPERCKHHWFRFWPRLVTDKKSRTYMMIRLDRIKTIHFYQWLDNTTPGVILMFREILRPADTGRQLPGCAADTGRDSQQDTLH